MKDMLDQAFDAEGFRKAAHEMVDQLADHLGRAQRGELPRAMPYIDPESAYDYWSADLQQQSGGSPKDLVAAVLDRSVQLHHPRYMGHQISPPLPMASLGGLMDNMLNNGMAVYEMGMASTAIERVVVEQVAAAMGFGPASGGLLTSGGTLANLTGLLAARQAKAPGRVWTEGHKQELALLVSEEAHYCVDRAVRIMGWGEGGVIKVPADEHYRMRHELLPEYCAAARAAGKTVVAVVGSACSTSTGAFDNLEAIADFCQAEGLWFHIDGAHGAALAFSPEHRSLLQGLSRADSVIMDFHKMLLTPALATALIFKDGRQAYRTFSQQAAYLWEGQQDEEWQNMAKRTFECTKYMMGLKVYMILRTYGTSLWEAYLSRVMATGKAFADLVEQSPDFELPVAPQCNIVCFRYRRPGLSEAELSRLNARIRQRLLEDGRFYVVQTSLRGHTYLRVTLTNPFTQPSDIEALLETAALFAEQELTTVAG